MFVDRARRVALWSGCALSLAAVPDVRADQAQKPARDPAAAEALYKTARDLLAKGDWDGACPKFDASMQLDPAASTLINVAKCRDHEGKLAASWAELKRAIVLNQETQGEERKKTLGELIDKALAELEPRLPKLNLTISPRPEGLTVLRDGVPIPLAMLDESIPLDPGAHMVKVEAPGYVSVERSVTAEAGRTAALDITLAKASLPPADKPAVAPVAQSSRSVPVWPFITGGIGLGLLGAGVGFRVHGMGVEATLDENCGEERVCDPASGYDPSEDNRQKNVDYGAFLGLTIGGGAALLGTALGVIIEVATEDSGSASALRVAPMNVASGGGFALEGTFP